MTDKLLVVSSDQTSQSLYELLPETIFHVINILRTDIWFLSSCTKHLSLLTLKGTLGVFWDPRGMKSSIFSKRLHGYKTRSLGPKRPQSSFV